MPDLAPAAAPTDAILAVARPGHDVAAERLRQSLRAQLVGESKPVVVGRYQVGARIGAGGMGTVYRAWDPELRRDVAVKLVPLPAGSDPERAVREARAMAGVSHPAVVPVFDVGIHDQEMYVVMALVRGCTLRSWLSPQRSQRERLDVLLAAGRGLAAAHAAGIVHHDFKPDNVLIDERGRAMVTDFGLAAIADCTLSSASGAHPGDSRDRRDASLERDDESTWAGGTLGYAAPERMDGRTGDARSDQFSWCATALEVLCDQPPFPGGTVDAIRDAVQRGPQLDARRLTRRLRRAVVRGLSCRPSDRFADMDRLLAAAAVRRQPRARTLVAMTGMLAAGLLVAGSSAPASQPDGCASLAPIGMLAQPQTRQPLEAALLAAGQPDALVALDTYADRWFTERRAACEAGSPAGHDSPRIACLRRLETALSGTALAMTRSKSAAERGMELVAALEAPPSCAQPERSPSANTATWADASDDIDRARRLLKAAQLLDNKADGEAALELIDEAEGIVADLPEGPVHATLLLRRGNALQTRGDNEAAARALEKAANLAVEYDTISVAVAASVGLIYIANRLQQPQEAEHWADMARAYAERSGDPVHLGSYHYTMGHATVADPPIARQHFARALDYYEAELGNERGAGLALQALSTYSITDGDLATAAEQLARSRALLQAATGADGFELASAFTNEARLATRLGHYERSLALFDQALTVAETRKGPDALEVGVIAENAAQRWLALDQPAKAEPLFARSVQIMDANFGPDAVYVTKPLIGLAEAMVKQGRADQARTTLARAERLLASAPPEHDPFRLNLLLVRARLNRDVGGGEAARKDLTAAWGIELANGSRPSSIAEIQFALAELAEVHGDSRLGVHWALQALRSLSDDGTPEAAIRRRDYTAWIDARQPTGVTPTRARTVP